MSRRAWLAALAVCSLLAACADLFGFHDLRQGVFDASPDVVDTCTHVVPPTAPQSGPVGTPTPYTLAVRHIYLTTTSDGGAGAFGYDLDGKCTVDLASASCKSAAPTNDGVGGVDNASIQLIDTVRGLKITTALDDPVINTSIDQGDFTIMVRIFGLQSDQNQAPSAIGLKVALQSSPGISGGGTPGWDGGDRWFVSGDDVVGGLDSGTNTPNRLLEAYVSNGVLVASDPQPLDINLYLAPGNTLSGPLHVKLSKPLISATLVKRSDGQYDLQNGVIVGRWAASDLLSSIAQLTINGQSLCTYLGGGAFLEVQQQVCGTRDLAVNGPDDDTAACDAVSVAVAFEAQASQVANAPQPFYTSATPCADASTTCVQADQ